MTVISNAGPEDYEKINNIAKVVWPHTYGKILSKEQLKYMFNMMYSHESYNEQITKKGHCYLLAHTSHGYTGFASYEPCYKTGITKIHKLYVLPGLQRRGVGQALLDKITFYAARNGDNIITLNVNRNNTALHFYEAKGFVITASEDISIGNGYLMEDYVMEREI